MLVSRTAFLDENNLRKILERSFIEFNVHDSDTQESIYSKYATELGNKGLISLELFEGKNLVASAITTYHLFYSNPLPIKLSFLTQVIVQEKFRGQGYLKKLIYLAKKKDEANSSLASIVIARRKVGNLYSKFGYRGFGVFPKVSFEKIQVSEFTALRQPQEWKLIARAYANSYQNIPGSILRTDKYWRYLSSEINKGKYSLGVIKTGNDLGYFIYSNGECFELASTNLVLFNDLVKNSLGRGIHSFKISSNHPAFQALISSGGVYSIRPEPTEGHMLRLYKNSGFLGDYLLENPPKILEDRCNKKLLMDINLLNEW